MRAGGTDLVSTLSQLNDLLVSEKTLEQALERVAELTVATVPGAHDCGVTLTDQPTFRTVAATSDRARAVDDLQYELDFGPCLQSLRTGEIVVVDDNSQEQRWGPFSARAAEATGVLSSLSLPLTVQGERLGVLNVYGLERHAFDTDMQKTLGELFAAQVALILTVVLRSSAQLQLTEQLQTALSSRAVIDQAMGVLMGAQRCSPEEAFTLLRRASQNRNIKLRDVAAEIVHRVQQPGSRPPV